MLSRKIIKLKLLSIAVIIMFFCSHYLRYNEHFVMCDNIQKSAGCMKSQLYYSCASLYLRPDEINQNRANHNDVIHMSYEIVSAYSGVRYSISCNSEGIEMLSPVTFEVGENEDEKIDFQFRTSSCGVGKIQVSISAYLGDDLIEHGKGATIYIYSTLFGDFLSLNCAEEAIELYKDYIYDKKINFKFIEYDNIFANYEVRDVIDNFLSVEQNFSKTGNINLSGDIYWTDINGTTHPASNMTIEFWDEDAFSNDYITSTVTDDSGHYNISFSVESGWNENYTFDLFVKAKTEGAGVTVINNGVYSKKSSTTNNMGAGTYVKNMTIGNSDVASKAFQVHQAMRMASLYTKKQEGNYLKSVEIQFPVSDKGTSYYSPKEQKIYIMEADANDWDVMQHEYGHYVQDMLDIDNGSSGQHSSINNLADAYGNKSIGIKLAWGEGWATFFAINLQRELGASTLNIPNVGDLSYSDTEDASIDINIESCYRKNYGYIRLGEANEASVAAVLLDLADGRNESYDEIYFSSQYMWNQIKNTAPTSLSDFICTINNSNLEQQSKLRVGKILNNFFISGQLSSPKLSCTTTPNFYWTARGGSKSYPNNRFRLAFYDSSFRLILKTEYTTATNQTLTLAQWQTILNAKGTNFICILECYQTAYPVTGLYYSNYLTLTKPVL